MTKLAAIPKLVLAFALTWLPANSTSAQLPFPANPDSDSPAGEVSLVSPQTGIDYAPLQKLLAQQKWRQANETTRELMLQAAGREAQGWVTAQDVEKFPCWDLKAIDGLWQQYSNGRFGFSVQFPIFVATGNKPGRLVASEAYEEFGDRVGWRQPNPDPAGGPAREWIAFKGNLNYSLEAPVGHLPNPRQEYQITGGRLEYTVLTQRLVACQLVSYPTPTNKK